MKYDKHHIDIIINALADGQGRVRACKMANIHYDTFLDWYYNKPEFSELVKKAEDIGNDKIKDLQKRKVIEDKSWQSGAWWLERNYPDEYRQRVSTETKSETKIIVQDENTANKIKDIISDLNNE